MSVVLATTRRMPKADRSMLTLATIVSERRSSRRCLGALPFRWTSGVTCKPGVCAHKVAGGPRRVTPSREHPTFARERSDLRARVRCVSTRGVVERNDTHRGNVRSGRSVYAHKPDATGARDEVPAHGNLARISRATMPWQAGLSIQRLPGAVSLRHVSRPDLASRQYLARRSRALCA